MDTPVVCALVLCVWLLARFLPPFSQLKRRTLHALFRAARSVPAFERRLDAERTKAISSVSKDLSEARVDGLSFTRVPEHGVPGPQVLEFLERCHAAERRGYTEKHVSGAVYTRHEENEKVIAQAVGMFSCSNPLHFDLFFCTRRMETETVRMVADFLHGDERVCGVMTTGGSESIIMSMKAYRDRAVAQGKDPDAIFALATETAHCAWLKAAKMLRVRLERVSMNSDLEMDADDLARKITPDTFMVIVSAPAFPHGVIDPIEKVGAVCDANSVGLHVDACLGGFVLAFAAKGGHPVPKFDFSVRGVTSVSCDTHKYGYAPKGTSVLLFENKELRRNMYFSDPNWPGGLYASPTMPGSRAGSQIVGAWTSIVLRGVDGFTQSASRIVATARKMIDGLQKIPKVRIMGSASKATFVVCFTTVGIDIYKVAECLAHMGWDLNCLQLPGCVHLVVTEGHFGCEEDFLAKVAKAVEEVEANPAKYNKRAPIYAVGASLPDREFVGGLLSDFIDATCDSL
eukprot:m51a1_g2693 putative sphingosine-1-phosphate lyase (515) ;mRNA; f:764492-766534